MPNLAGYGGSITINNADALSLVVTITAQAGAVTVYADASRVTPVSFPDTITGPRTYYFQDSGVYLVSVQFNGQEIAGPRGTQLPVVLVDGASYTFQPGIDTAEQAALLLKGGTGGGATIPAGTYEPSGLASGTLSTLDIRYQPKGSYEAAGLSAGTLTTLDGRYQPVGSYQPAGSYEPAGLSSNTLNTLAKIRTVNTTALTVDGPLVTNKHQAVDATSGVRTMTLPTGASGDVISVEKYDSSTNAVNITGTIRTTAGSSISLTLSKESIALVCDGTGWWPFSSRISKSTLDATYAPLGASYKMALSSSGDTLTDGYELEPNGIPVVQNGTVTAFAVVLDFPGAVDQTWQLVAYHTDNSSTVLGTVTIVAGNRGAVVNSLTGAVVAGDLLLPVCTTVFGTSYGGLGPSARVALGGSLSLPAAPSAPTGLSYTSGATSATLTWTKGVGSRSTLIAKYNTTTQRYEAYATTSGTSFTDTGLTGGATYQYKLYAAVPGACSAPTTALSVTPTQSYSYFSQSDGAPSGFSVVSGGGAGTSATVASNVLHLVSGSAGNNAVADREDVVWTGNAGTFSKWVVTFDFALDQSNSIFDVYLSATTPTSAFNETNWVQFEFTPTQIRIGYKASGYSSNSFQTLLAYTNYPTAVNANGTTFYSAKVDITDPGDGTLLAHAWQGPSGGSLSLVGTGTTTSSMKAALAAGGLNIRQLGNTGATAGITCGSKIRNLVISAS